MRSTRWALGWLVAGLGVTSCVQVLGRFDFEASSSTGGSASSSTSASNGSSSSASSSTGGSGSSSGATNGTFTLSATPASVLVKPGASVQVTVSAQRSNFNDPIAVSVSGLPADVTATGTTIDPPPAAQSATITLTADGSALPGDSAQASFVGAAGATTAPAASVLVTVAGPTGTLDTSFPATPPFTSGLGTIQWAAAQPDGKVVLFGTFHATPADAPAVVLRMNPDGSLDTSFQTKSIATSASASPLAQAVKGLVQADGRILVAWTQGSSAVLNLTRLLSDGSLDTTWNNPNTATVSAIAYTATNPPVVPLALQASDGAVVYAPPLAGGQSGVSLYRYTSAGVPDPTVGIAGDFGNVYEGVATPVLEIDGVSGLFPQSDGTTYLLGKGIGGQGFSSQVSAQFTSTLTLDTAYGSSGSGWDWGLRGSQNVYDSVMVGSTLYGAVSQEFAPCTSAVTLCVSAWTIGAQPNQNYACPDVSTGLGCGDVATRITPGPNGTLLVAGFSPSAGGLPIAARFTQAPLAADAAFGTDGVTKLRASSTSATTGMPAAIVSASDGSTLVFTQDPTYPIQRLWP
jgi:uncharacterized delta-60 repeat protein